MKILVTIKRTPHRDVKMRIAPDGKSLVTHDIKFEVNPFDELAVEEALRIKEAGKANEIVVVTVGPAVCQEQLLTALAMGADRAIRVDTDAMLDSLQVARVLAAVIRKESPDVVIMGKLATDDENWQICPMVAELIGWPQAGFASKIQLSADGKSAKVTCEVDAGLEEVEVNLPAVITTDLRLNEPRYASLPGIMKAKRKPSSVIPLAELGDIGPSRAKTTAYRPLPAKQKGILVDSADTMAATLAERKLI
jgi:electron transfer flavoprotein beta subunit